MMEMHEKEQRRVRLLPVAIDVGTVFWMSEMFGFMNSFKT